MLETTQDANYSTGGILETSQDANDSTGGILETSQDANDSAGEMLETAQKSNYSTGRQKLLKLLSTSPVGCLNPLRTLISPLEVWQKLQRMLNFILKLIGIFYNFTKLLGQNINIKQKYKEYYILHQRDAKYHIKRMLNTTRKGCYSILSCFQHPSREVIRFYVVLFIPPVE